MSIPELSVSVRIARVILDRAAEFGLDRAELLEATGLGEEHFRDPDGRVSNEHLGAVWQTVVRRLGNPDLGLLVGGAIRVRDFGLVGYLMCCAEDLRASLTRLTRFSRILVEGSGFELSESGGLGYLQLESSPGLTPLRERTDAYLAAVLSAGREITGTRIRPAEVFLPYDRPGDTGALERLFDAPLRFGRATAGMAIRSGDLDLPICTADTTLCGYLDDMAEEKLRSRREEDTFTGETSRALWAALGAGRPTLATTAEGLGVSVRTLQRRLSEEGTSFREVLDELRRQMATRLLLDRKVSVAEIAWRLGFSEPSTFYRALRRWKGASPHEFRSSG